MTTAALRGECPPGYGVAAVTEVIHLTSGDRVGRVRNPRGNLWLDLDQRRVGNCIAMSSEARLLEGGRGGGSR